MDHNSVASILKTYFGHSGFRPKQFEIINSIIEGRDCIALLPTGGGKSLCYQLPAVYLKSKCLVISPLIALMEDQVASLKEKAISAFLIHSGMNSDAQTNIFQKYLDSPDGILYVSPERVSQYKFVQAIKEVRLSHIAIDEAHCISQWGHDFRPSYLKIAKFVGMLAHKPQITALTATATSKTLEDIQHYAGLTDPILIKNSFFRENIDIEIQYKASPFQHLYNTLVEGGKTSQIIYARSRRGVKIISEKLSFSGHNASYYHGNLPFDLRNKVAESWRKGKNNTIVATNAFGMGIDKSDVRNVYHLDIPPSIEEYYQEIGRAGRDGLPSRAIMVIEDDNLEHAKTNLSREMITQDVWERFHSGLTAKLNESGDGILYPVIVNKLAGEMDMHTFQVIKCLRFYSREGALHVSEGIFEPSRVMFTHHKARKMVFHAMPGLKYRIADHLLKNYEHLYDNHNIIIEEQVGKALEVPYTRVEESLIQLEKEKILSYQKRRTIPYIKLLQDTLPEIPIDEVRKIQEVKSNKLEAMLSYILEERCRMQVLMEYFNESCSPCDRCDNCKKKHGKGDGFTKFFNKLYSSQNGSSLDLRKELMGITKPQKIKIIDKLKVLENEGLISIQNGKIIVRNPKSDLL